jgi:hypothetical protein
MTRNQRSGLGGAALAVGAIAVAVIWYGSAHTSPSADVAPPSGTSTSVANAATGHETATSTSATTTARGNSAPAAATAPPTTNSPTQGTTATSRTTVPVLTPTTLGLSQPVLTIEGGNKTMACNTAPVTCDAKPGDDLKLAIRSRPFASIQSVCLTFHFRGDLLDPGEQLQWTDAGGFIGGSSSVRSRQSCATPTGQPKVTDSLRDGYQLFDVWMQSGSAHVDHIDVAITGVYA